MSDQTVGAQQTKVGTKVYPMIHSETNKPGVVIFFGDTAFRIMDISLAMKLGDDICNAANLASLQAAFRAYLIEKADFTAENADYLLAQFGQWVEEGGADSSNNNIVQFRPPTEGDSEATEDSPEHSV